MLTAIGYARISRDDALEGRGVARQSADIADVCDRNGWELGDVLVDNDVSASRYSRKVRPGYQKLVDAIAAGTVDRAVVYDLDRLLRQPRQLEDLIDLCETRPGFELHSINGQTDLSTSSGRFVTRVLVNKAAMESDDLSRRLKRANDQRAADGLPHGGRAFGYEPDGITIRPYEAAAYVQAVEDVLTGVSLATIARRWNDAGLLTPQRRRPWSSTVVKATLTSPRHAGLRVHRGAVIGEGVWPPLVDRITHERVVALLTSRRGVPGRPNAFGGLVTDVNGVPLDRDTQRGRPTYRGRRRPDRPALQVSIAAESLERWIVASLFEAVEDGRLDVAASDRTARLETPADLTGLEDDLRALADDFGHGRISRAEWLAARKPLEARIQAAQASTPAGRPSALTRDLRGRWDTLDVGVRRLVLRHVFDRVEVGPARQRGGPQPLVPDVGRIDLARVTLRWRAPSG